MLCAHFGEEQCFFFFFLKLCEAEVCVALVANMEKIVG